MATDLQIKHAATVLKRGGVIAYPTESCYGFGCLPDNIAGVERILSIKQRSWEKGLILVADNLASVSNYILPLEHIEPSALKCAQTSWPGPFTWLFPASTTCTHLLTGQFDTLAIRLSAHQTIKQLCQVASSAMVSTSANKQGEATLVSYDQVMADFSDELDYVLEGQVGTDTKPSEIRDLLTQTLIRGA